MTDDPSITHAPDAKLLELLEQLKVDLRAEAGAPTLNCHQDDPAKQVESAYDDLVRIGDRDYATEYLGSCWNGKTRRLYTSQTLTEIKG
jgi:hypothetical protein